jgi:hypothetical protein
MIQGHPRAERPAAGCVEGKPRMPIRFETACSHEAGKRRVPGNHRARRPHRSGHLTHLATALTSSSRVLPASLGCFPTDGMPRAAAQGASVNHCASAQLACCQELWVVHQQAGTCPGDALWRGRYRCPHVWGPRKLASCGGAAVQRLRGWKDRPSCACSVDAVPQATRGMELAWGVLGRGCQRLTRPMTPCATALPTLASPRIRSVKGREITHLKRDR